MADGNENVLPKVGIVFGAEGNKEGEGCLLFSTGWHWRVQWLSCKVGREVIDDDKKSRFILMCCALSALQRVCVNLQDIAKKCSVCLFKVSELAMFSH